MVCDTVYRFRCVESAVTANFLEIALNSPAVVAAIDKQKAGISESGVSLTHDKLGEIQIPVPPLGEQERIVAEVDRHLSRADALATSIAQAKRRAQRLRRSILAAAFQGRLVPQDPNDEPASVLLDRIRAQVAAAEQAVQQARRGRPSASAAPPAATDAGMTPPAPRRGRPPGSKNTTTAAPDAATQPRRRGRPPGSKNRPKT
jgi:type I restriction enzyme S subunit